METHELLEMLLYSSLPRCNTNQIAHALLKRFNKLEYVFEASIPELMQVEGIGRSCAVQIKLVNALIQRVAIESRIPIKQYLSEQSIIDYIRPMFVQLNVERLYMMCFDDAAHMLCCEKISEGSVSAVAVNSQNMLHIAAINKASWIVLAHNHPHGLACPTLEDRATTQKYRTIFEHAGMPIVEHFVIAQGKFFPMLRNEEDTNLSKI